MDDSYTCAGKKHSQPATFRALDAPTMKSVPPLHSRTGIFSHLTGFLSAATQYLSARLALAGLEAKEAGMHYGIAAGLIAGGLFIAVLGYVLFVITAVFAIAAAFDGEYAWIIVMGAAALFHLAGAAALVFFGLQRLRTGAFSSTLEELKKDQAWLTNLANNR